MHLPAYGYRGFEPQALMLLYWTLQSRRDNEKNTLRAPCRRQTKPAERVRHSQGVGRVVLGEAISDVLLLLQHDIWMLQRDDRLGISDGLAVAHPRAVWAARDDA